MCFKIELNKFRTADELGNILPFFFSSSFFFTKLIVVVFMNTSIIPEKFTIKSPLKIQFSLITLWKMFLKNQKNAPKKKNTLIEQHLFTR